ncbi:MAG: ABC transporter ATP-binding protein [Methylococcaceae bacterium]|nr:MAG: ABC transporter ATP-binding protein [Methylococcaceae bacterium]
MADVTFQGVDKNYGAVLALSQLDLAVADGELLVCVGSSGCGKSTLLRLVAGLEQPSAGSIAIGGREVNRVPPQQRNVSMVFQDYALYPHMSVRQNLAFPLKMQGLPPPEIERRVWQAAQRIHMEDLLDRLPKQLSGGQRQRAAMGRALVREPSVFLLDEPLSNLDAKLRGKVRAEIAELQANLGTTMIYVTHDQVEAMTLGHRVAVFHQGRLQQVAAPKTLYLQPANTFVAGFIGNPPMNVLPVRLAGDNALVIGAQPLNVAIDAGRLQHTASIGIRPEALQVTDAAAGALTGQVENCECLGHETLLYVALDGVEYPLIVRLSGMTPIHKGETVYLTVDPGHLHFFDHDGNAMPLRQNASSLAGLIRAAA